MEFGDVFILLYYHPNSTHMVICNSSYSAQAILVDFSPESYGQSTCFNDAYILNTVVSDRLNNN